MIFRPDLILIDGTSYIYRAFHALPPLTTSTGKPTGATRGFAAMLRKLIEKYPGVPMVMVFDAKGPNFRNDYYQAYKANRPPMPNELRVQIEDIKKLSTLFITLVLVLNMNAAFAQSQGLLKDKLTNIFDKYSEETSLVPFADTTSKYVIDDGSYFSITTVIFAFSGLLKYAAYAIMLILAAVSIFRLVTAGSGGSEEVYGNIKNYIKDFNK